MPTKEEVLDSIKNLAGQNAINREEILNAFNQGANTEGLEVGKELGIANILYYIGGAIVFFGIAIFIQQNWNALDIPTRITSTLGASVVAYMAATLFGMKKKTENVSLAFHLISALVMPLGLYITFHESGFNVDTNGMQALISGILFVVYISSFAAFRKNIFILFSTIFGTWLFFSFTSYIAAGNPIFNSDFFNYRILATGLAYMLLGYSFSMNNRKPLSGFLYGFGILGFLGAAMSLGGWKPGQNIFWELIFPGLIFVTLFLSIYLKSSSFLTFGTIFLMAYIIKITAEYFSGSMGWPLSLVIIGLLLIASGYLFIYLKNQYLPKRI